jgi:L-threonylcarbamoyladenylate synthase
VKTKLVFPRSAAERTDTVALAVSLLESGECVALPTETVYGLAANALSADAVVKIFEAKYRPRLDPLIVHLPDGDWLERLARVRDEDRPLIEKLTDRFWPGPFTIILPRRSIVPDIVTGGQETIAVRMSSHRMFSEIIGAFGLPLAAPSANRFGRVSPTTAQHVLEELGGRVPLIVDAGPTMLGIESTIVAIRKGTIEILRRGPVTEEDLFTFGTVRSGTGFSPSWTALRAGSQPVVQNREHRQDADATRISVPGQFSAHYAPKTPLQLIGKASEFSPPEDQHVGLLAWNPVKSEAGYSAIRQLSARRNLREAAANLFRLLRELDALNLDLIVAEQVPDRGLGAAIMDRLRRAAGGGARVG